MCYNGAMWYNGLAQTLTGNGAHGGLRSLRPKVVGGQTSSGFVKPTVSGLMTMTKMRKRIYRCWTYYINASVLNFK